MKQRVLTGVIAGAGFLSLIIIGGWPFAVLMFAIATIGTAELLKMKHIPILSAKGFIGIVFMWILLVPDNFALLDWIPLHRTELFLLLIVLLLGLTVLSKNKFSFDDAGFTVLTSVYVGFGFHYFMFARFVEDGLLLIFLILILVWATDSGAYFAGRKFGKHKLAPSISPKKTVEGSAGGVMLALAIGSLYTLFFPFFDTWALSLAFMIVVSLTGQVGDLIESAFKRHYAVKDSGNVLPGHGGILDRFDSLIFVMPVVFLLGFF
ncbi:phosphatidate cytidylyltransferase [Salisediminibacterium halotolerans]|uniref:Phosphatidate cytidylyltransferase n=1 Tax=Salisediminibacterium halotolerans TaxID=517425 RepID=A0A1H9Q9G8_9BACI|nr:MULTISPECIES: phosphatidate cytidylyltransferase [Salisediminibacterium]RLJ74186.1 phosphatidate cytidylyltransferase [Actinophytocola xinjiangensis]RPE87721.1 phosphatidate cytidylyltransferase [Salisediminibacterium halotolerans]TWG35023.1 phosphatidate cytidylyltransferase [Salisediminibacterium halotolerans]SER56493.1 phosphatidate cytidylyltransferase [Salisediminibacterium haloalkalitolerans]GEL06690.1 phosphatidate cytidylyltransferase [Salisediminibacterium halotolerans]